VGFNQILTNAKITNNGRNINFDFGNITNTNTDDNASEIITLIYTVVSANNNQIYNGRTRNNNASWKWNDNQSINDEAPNITIVELNLTIAKNSNISTEDKGSIITYTINVKNTGNSLAFDVAIGDLLPNGMKYVSNSFGSNSIYPVTEDLDSLSTLSAKLSQINANETISITYQAKIQQSVLPGQKLTNTAKVEWSSLLGNKTTTTSPYIKMQLKEQGILQIQEEMKMIMSQMIQMSLMLLG
jgi:large repetitive protein